MLLRRCLNRVPSTWKLCVLSYRYLLRTSTLSAKNSNASSVTMDRLETYYANNRLEKQKNNHDPLPLSSLVKEILQKLNRLLVPPTDVQISAIPVLVASEDASIQSYTAGYVKTLAYLLPILSLVGPQRQISTKNMQDPVSFTRGEIEAIVVSPPREHSSKQEEAITENKPPIIRETWGDYVVKWNLSTEKIQRYKMRIQRKEDEIKLYFELLQDCDPGVQKLALERMRQEIRNATLSEIVFQSNLFMFFLKIRYKLLKSIHEGMPAGENKKCLADIISVLSMLYPEELKTNVGVSISSWEKKQKNVVETLKYKLLGLDEDIGYWGSEYVRYLNGGVVYEFGVRQRENKPVDDLIDLVKQIVSFCIKHDEEHAAIYLLIAIKSFHKFPDFIDKENFKRICTYLTIYSRSMRNYEGNLALDICYQTYMKFKQYPDALIYALQTDNLPLIKQTLSACDDVLLLKQICYILARQGVAFEIKDCLMSGNEDKKDLLQEFVNNKKISEGYLILARYLDVMKPKVPEDLFKFNDQAIAIDSTRENLAATFVNAFVNAGFGQDTLMTPLVSEGSTTGDWILKNKDHEKTSAIASLGLIALWNVDEGLSRIEKYLYSSDNHVVAGALLGVGILNSGVHSECHSAYAKFVAREDPAIRVGAVLGLGLAYAGTNKEELYSLLGPIITDARNNLDVVAFSALSLGIIYTGSCHEGVRQKIIHALMARNEVELADPLARFLCLGLGLLYLGSKSGVNATMEVVKALDGKISKYLQVTLEICAYAGSKDHELFQQFRDSCEKHSRNTESVQSSAVLGIALVNMDGSSSQSFAVRLLQSLFDNGEPHIRRSVPLALGLLSVSNPQENVVATLTSQTHDDDIEVAMNAVIALGLIGAGTNNECIARRLQWISRKYEDLNRFSRKNDGRLFCVRIALSLLHLGKGLLTLNPFHSNGFLMSKVALSGLITVVYGCMDMKSVILGKYHYVLYFLTLAMQPRMLMMFDEEMRPLSVPIRVRKIADVEGHSNQTWTRGFATHLSPLLLAIDDRVELATKKYIPMSSVLEGFVILKENPDYEQRH